MSAVLALHEVSKAFGGVRALRGVSFDVQAGEVHALVGENGAGKSTLVRIVTGALRQDAGTLEVGGQRVEHADPLLMRTLGVAPIYQQPALCPDLSVAENLALRLERGGSWRRIDWRARRGRAAALLQQVGASGASIDIDAPARSLRMAEQQLVEIAGALGAEARILLMDEPTAALTDREAVTLFALLRELRARGTAIVYISHRLEEIESLADRVTVLRDGALVATRPMAEVTRAQLIRLMVGRDVDSVYARPAPPAAQAPAPLAPPTRPTPPARPAQAARPGHSGSSAEEDERLRRQRVEPAAHGPGVLDSVAGSAERAPSLSPPRPPSASPAGRAESAGERHRGERGPAAGGVEREAGYGEGLAGHVETPTVKMPAVEMSALEMPGVEMPALEMPAVEMSAVEMPAVEMSAVQMPAGRIDVPLLVVEGLGCRASGVRDVTLQVRAGEIVGLAGLVGAGRTELARVLFGLTPADAGVIRLGGAVGGRAVRIQSPADAVRHGIAYVPEDRRAHGVVSELSVAANVTLASLRTAALSRRGWLDVRRERAIAADYVQRFAIKTPSLDARVGTLSGGNQQKVALARWLALSPRVLILDEPTQGVDIGAKAEIHRLIVDLAARGLAILLISSELPEILALSDRIAVMRAGTIAGTLSRDDATPDAILTLALGHVPELAVDATREVRP